MKKIDLKAVVTLILLLFISFINIMVLSNFSLKIAILGVIISQSFITIFLLVAFKNYKLIAYLTVVLTNTFTVVIGISWALSKGQARLEYKTFLVLAIVFFIPVSISFIFRLLDKKRLFFGFDSFFRYITILFIPYYCFTLIYSLFLKNHLPLKITNHTIHINLIPFRTIIPYLFDTVKVNRSVSLYNIIANIMLFCPLGFYASIYKNKIGLCKEFGLSVILIVLIESVQFFTGVGVADIDDLLLNFIGMAVGFGIAICLEKIYKRNFKGSEEPLFRL